MLEPEFTRVRRALEYAFLPTAVLVRGRNFTRDFDAVEPPWKLPRRKSQVAVLAVLISLHHFPFLAALEQAYHVELPWAVQLPSWAGPCRIARRHRLSGAALACEATQRGNEADRAVRAGARLLEAGAARTEPAGGRCVEARWAQKLVGACQDEVAPQ